MLMYSYSVEFDYLQGEALVMGYDIMGYSFSAAYFHCHLLFVLFWS